MQTEFDDWFETQHGKRCNMPNYTDQELRAMVLAGKDADRMLASRALWDAKQKTALYAWGNGRQQKNTYMRDNPLGGPAAVFAACADAIRAGDDVDAAMAAYGLAWNDR